VNDQRKPRSGNSEQETIKTEMGKKKALRKRRKSGIEGKEQ